MRRGVLTFGYGLLDGMHLWSVLPRLAIPECNGESLAAHPCLYFRFTEQQCCMEIAPAFLPQRQVFPGLYLVARCDLGNVLLPLQKRQRREDVIKIICESSHRTSGHGHCEVQVMDKDTVDVPVVNERCW